MKSEKLQEATMKILQESLLKTEAEDKTIKVAGRTFEPDGKSKSGLPLFADVTGEETYLIKGKGMDIYNELSDLWASKEDIEEASKDCKIKFEDLYNNEDEFMCIETEAGELQFIKA